MPLERLQKIIARAGVSSRRKAEELIVAGRVRVNGQQVVELGTKADPRKDRIEVDGRRLAHEDFIYVLVHKPRGCVSTVKDPEGRPTVADLVASIPARLYPVGRLDYGTSGVLLMTNDGEFTQALLRPEKKVPKIYVVKLSGVVSDEQMERWRSGVQLDDGRTLPAKVRLLRYEGQKTWLEITLREGRNQQIRRTAEVLGHETMRLARLAFADIDAEGLRPGQWRLLTVDELKKLKREYGVPRRVRPQSLPTERATKPARTARHGGRGGVKAGRSDRSGTTPRAADRPSSRGRGRGHR
ncbi:MAG: pseudouridine synthase [Deltaproteobacteria bacterium]|nr:MAG: pseudouridine synthase [Deltaproteobacteria bacterium]